MINPYSFGKIYKLFPETQPENFYIGSTTSPLNIRLTSHKSAIRRNNLNSKLGKVFKPVVENLKIELLEAFPCIHKRELEKQETEFIRRLNPPINHKIAYLSEDEKNEKNKKHKCPHCEKCLLKVSMLRHCQVFHQDLEQSEHQRQYEQLDPAKEDLIQL